MATVKSTTLPNILSEYSSSYQQRKHSPRKVQRKRELPDRVQDGSSAKGREDVAPSLSHSRSKPLSPLLRESSFHNRKNQDKQRRERMFEFWQSLKEEVRDQETERLQEKVTVQQELIRAQDEQHHKRQQQRNRRDLQKRDHEKGKRNARTEKLQEICRQSLSEDRKAAAERKNAQKSKALRKSTNTTLTASAVSEDDTRDLSPPDTGSHLSLASTVLPPPPSGEPGQRDGGAGEVFMTLQEEQEEDDEEYISDGDEELLPWHHVQLYRLYGRNADYFLHPKIETEQKTTIQLNPRLRAIGGQAGAAVLWRVLRNESRQRLVHQDSKLLSPELKSAFGAFTREGLLKQRQPVRRNYNSGDDVPDLSRLMDQTKVHNAQDFRHKVELMFRSSTINQDRTKVLLYNNPAPDLNNHEGGESVQRYMPSWADGEQWDEESELSYKKWLRESHPENGQGDSATIIDGSPSVDTARPPNASADIPTEDWKAILSHATRRRVNEKTTLPKYIFLTEADTTCPGEFSKQRKEMAENRNVPKAYGDGIPNKSLSPMSEVIGDGEDVMSSSPTADSHHAEPEVTSVRGLPMEMSQELVTSWEPLSLHALEEYGERRDVLGQGRFNQGKVTVWASANN